MSVLSKGTIRAAIKTVRTHRGRSLLTMLGIIIGISSVVTIVSIGEGIKHQVTNQINRVGNSLITVRAGQVSKSASGFSLFEGPKGAGNLSDKDILTVTHAKSINVAAPLGLVGGSVKAEHGNYTDGSVVASTQDLPRLLNQSVAYGAFFTSEDDGQNVAIIGQHAAEVMFDAEVPLGRTFTFRGQEFMVRGIFNGFGAAPLSSDVEFNNAIYIPYATAKQLTGNTITPYEILAKPSNSKQVPVSVAAIQKGLLKNHGDTHDFSVLQASDSLAATSSVLNLLTELIAGAAAVSLFVGGIGIANIMLVSVTERMHEVGIRKAVGATNRQILNEFMAEAIVLSVIGGVLGIIVSLVVDIVLRLLTSLTPVLEWQVIIGSALVSMIIGILFGSVPALKAARKDPIAALRGE